MSEITRRRFIGKAVAGAGMLWLTPELSAARPSAGDRIEVGGTGVRISRVAMGTGYKGWERQSNQTRMGQQGFTRLMRHGFDSGLNFYDLADLYGSHSFMRHTLKEMPRDDVVLLTKIWFTEEGGMEATERALPAVERFRLELDRDVIDICLIHCVRDADWPTHRARMRDELSELKTRGVVRAVGCSCHDFGALQVAARDPWVDLIFARINHQAKVMDHADPDAVAAVLREARANGKTVVGMKIFGAGQLVDSQQRDDSLRYVWGNQLVDSMTIGFETPQMVDDTMENLTRVLRV